MADTTEVPAGDVPEDAAIVDVREDDEWAAGRVPGSVHIPLGQVPSRLGELPDGDFYVICRSGARSGRAVAWLRENGYPAVNVGGGILDWAAAGRPVQPGSGGPGQIV
jgi:rhodanese-related sulfurtransferase